MKRLSRTEIGRRVSQTADRLALNDVLERRPAQLSGGERQRVALARALVREPRAFLLDEPFAQLDARLRAQLRAELLALHASLGATMIYVTHDQFDALTMGQRIAVLADGRLRQVGTPAELYRTPADVFVARFIGNPGMNILPATVLERRGETIADCGNFSVAAPLSGYSGQAHVGVRPEHLVLRSPDQDGADGSGVVRLVELLGAETFVHLDAAGQPLVARVPGTLELRAGDRVGFRLDRSHLHFFDVAETRLA
jgi:ABC-type sugar transport system ATPase subunit